MRTITKQVNNTITKQVNTITITITTARRLQGCKTSNSSR